MLGTGIGSEIRQPLGFATTCLNDPTAKARHPLAAGKALSSGRNPLSRGHYRSEELWLQ
jgi:hypothetical protein